MTATNTDAPEFHALAAEPVVWHIEDVFRFALEVAGWDEAQTRSFMRANGLTHFPVKPPAENLSAWCTATGIIRNVSVSLARRPKGVGAPSRCPRCGFPTERAYLRDGMYGWRHGWRCLSGEDCFSIVSWESVFHRATPQWSYEI